MLPTLCCLFPILLQAPSGQEIVGDRLIDHDFSCEWRLPSSEWSFLEPRALLAFNDVAFAGMRRAESGLTALLIAEPEFGFGLRECAELLASPLEEWSMEGGFTKGQVSGQEAIRFSQLSVGGDVTVRKHFTVFGHQGYWFQLGLFGQADALADGFRLVHRILPPTATPKRPAVMVKAVRCIQRAEIIRAFPTVYKSELCAESFLPVVSRGRPQWAASRAFFVRVMKGIDVIIAFFVLTSRIFGRDPRAIAFGVK